jgi:hypothetical protein
MKKNIPLVTASPSNATLKPARKAFQPPGLETKKQYAKIARTGLYLMALVATYGCSTAGSRPSGASWGQTVARDERAQEIITTPQDDWQEGP